MRRLVLSLAATLLISVVSTTWAQTVRHVPANYPTIQAAIDAAKSGDTVLVQPGKFTGDLDFKGKNIRVTGAKGAQATTIQGSGKASVVRIASGEGSSAILEGFTITGGTALDGGGIYCRGSSPTIRDNRIEFNKAEADGGTCRGGGIFCSGGAPFIGGNIIHYNQATGIKSLRSTTGKGGGIYLKNATAVVVNNVLAVNAASSGGVSYPPGSFGGGLYMTGGTVTMTNDTIMENTAMSNSIFQSFGGGVYAAGGSLTITNSIVRRNYGTGYQDQMVGATSVTYSNIENGMTGAGNIDADPKFVNVTTFGEDDYHLRFDSPCVDAGSHLAPQLPAQDIDGSPRRSGSRVDMGVDEASTHVYYTGKAAPSTTYWVNITGAPGQPCIWAHSLHLLVPPVSFPGITGLFHLHPTYIRIIPISPMPASGVIRFPVNLPANVPVVSVPMQALVGFELTDVTMVHVVHW